MDLAAILARACRLDVVAFKPGNVSLRAAGHRMVAADFLASARVAAPALARPGAGVGERIEHAVTATLAAVGQNTNLGIVLLLAPLARATELTGGDLRERLARVLDALTVEDSVACFRAIRAARPAGLGTAAREDVHDAPQRDLRSVMALAADRDRIARQYAEGYAEVFDIGVPCLRAARARWHSLAWAVTACQLAFLASAPDSHVARKHGNGRARALAATASEMAKALEACENPRSLAHRLEAWDAELKSKGVNPGTSADLTVASVAVLLLQERLF